MPNKDSSTREPEAKNDPLIHGITTRSYQSASKDLSSSEHETQKYLNVAPPGNQP
jgi:hypothetical protein